VSRPARPVRPARPASPARREQPVSPWPSIAAGVGFFALYAALAPAVAGDKDSGEFTLVLATRGLAHPTGYPLYTLAGALFVRIAHALGASWAQAANLFSALGAGVAMGALHALAARLLEARTGPRAAAGLALVPLLALGLNPVWTREATLAEVNSWHVAWVCGAALVARGALLAIERAGQTRTPPVTWAAAWGLVAGVGLAHHGTSVLFSLPLTILLAGALVRRGQATPRLVVAGIAGALLPLVSLVHVAWRAGHPVAGQWPELEASGRSVFDHVTGTQYRTFLGRFAPSPIQRALLEVHVVPWLVPALAGALGAIASPLPEGRPWRAALGVAVLDQVACAFLYGVSDPTPYFLPALAVGLALFVAGLANVGALRRHGRALVAAAVVVLVVPGMAGWRTARARNETLVRFDALLDRMWDAVPVGPVFVVWDDDMASRLVARQVLAGERREVEVVQPRHLTHTVPRRRFIERHGFDPIAGIPPGPLAAATHDDSRSRALVDAISERINASTRWPVVRFLPEIPSMRQLQKADSTRLER
jgi:hypothetical protein